MKQQKGNHLFVFDLDETLLWCSYSPKSSTDVYIGNYQYLVIRPFAVELLLYCSLHGDCMLYTSSKKQYALKATHLLASVFIKLLTRKDTIKKETYYQKVFQDVWLMYDRIYIIDDSLHYWKPFEHDNVKWIKVNAYRGEINDIELIRIKDLVRHDLSI